MTLYRAAWLLLCALWASCASVPEAPEEPEAGEYPEAYDRLPEGACVTFLCAEEVCGLFRCEDVAPPRVVRTRSTFVLPPSAVRSPQRNWGTPQKLPWEAEPVFVVHWHGRELLPSQKRFLEMMRALASQPREKHHIFPQEQGLKAWFESRGINIHKETMLLDLETHHRIHKGTKGGPWNEAWRTFRDAHGGATQEEMYRYARELIIRFDLIGPILPYHMLVGPPIEL